MHQCGALFGSYNPKFMSNMAGMGMEKPTKEIYDSLLKAYDYFNHALFNGQLPEVVFTFHRQRKVMGYASIGRWVNEARLYVDELAVNPEYFAKYPLMEICQTLCHEMVHIWQAHSGKPGRRGYHNAQWAKKMIAIGLIPSSTGKPGGQQTGEWMMDYVLYDGGFHNACQTFLNSGYSLPWVDRYPVYRLELPVLAFDDSGAAVELDKKLRAKPGKSVATTLARKAEKSDFLELVSVADDSSSLIFSSSNFIENLMSQDDIFSGLITSKPKPRSGRIKYCCKSCRVQLWGKPGVNVICGDCNIKMEEVE